MKMPAPPSNPALTPEEEATVDALVEGHDERRKESPGSDLITLILSDHSQGVRDELANRLKQAGWVVQWQNSEHLKVSKPRRS